MKAYGLEQRAPGPDQVRVHRTTAYMVWYVLPFQRDLENIVRREGGNGAIPRYLGPGIVSVHHGAVDLVPEEVVLPRRGRRVPDPGVVKQPPHSEQTAAEVEGWDS